LKTLNSFSVLLLIVLSLTSALLLATVTESFGADSPKYILGLVAVDQTGTSLTPVNPVINPGADRIATIAVAVTTQIPQGLRVMEDGFSNPVLGINFVDVVPNATIQNVNGSVTSKYLIELVVPVGTYSSPIDFTYYVNVVEQPNQPAVNHNATIQFTVNTSTAPTSTANPTPSSTSTLTPSASPVSSPNPSPSVPEFPTWIILPLFIAATVLAFASTKKKTAKSS
jgi:hypothetical protein